MKYTILKNNGSHTRVGFFSRVGFLTHSSNENFCTRWIQKTGDGSTSLVNEGGEAQSPIHQFPNPYGMGIHGEKRASVLKYCMRVWSKRRYIAYFSKITLYRICGAKQCWQHSEDPYSWHISSLLSLGFNFPKRSLYTTLLLHGMFFSDVLLVNIFKCSVKKQEIYIIFHLKKGMALISHSTFVDHLKLRLILHLWF